METTTYLSVILLIIAEYIFNVGAIQCYRCMFAPYIYDSNANLCKDFDYSDKFIVDCPYSTFCTKKNSHAVISDVLINGTERDCALQKLTTQKIREGKWHQAIEVEEPYTEGCKINSDKGLRTASIEHCYCRGDLCNAGYRYNALFPIYLFTIILVCRL
ncbi:uncharacterized protein LOC143194029 [Rhynchophorus ferrugineus]|uniref:Protein sleepless n=1 Tax=Rhynchophorus ferrugineus TaxID=354439 RepID=A0A834MM57_RHYFE|nr:hypothetical protein GWI33_023257 [Rhynchophorus ferrugineus]